MRLVLLFSGQGEQSLEHRDALLSAPPGIRGAVERSLGVHDLSRLSQESLWDNQVAQLLIWGVQIARWKQLCAWGIEPLMVCGYSAGKMAACEAAGWWSEGAGAALVATRASLMSQAACLWNAPSGMVAVQVSGARLQQVLSGLVAEVAIRMGEDRYVVGGLESSLDELESRLRSVPGTSSQRLRVRVPAHTSLLASALEPWRHALGAAMGPASCLPVLSDVMAREIRNRDMMLSALSRQICTALSWKDCLDSLMESRADTLLEIGPGNALIRMAMHHGVRCRARSWDDFRSSEAVCDWLRGTGS